MTELVKDVVVLPAGHDRWILYNVFTRTAIGLDGRALAATGRLGLAEPDASAQATFMVWQIGSFTNERGLLADPTRIIRDPEAWPVAEELGPDDFLRRLREMWFIIDDMDAYRARFAPKTTMLDTSHFGNFHQQLGGHLLLHRRQDPATWWLTQKFEDDLSRIRRNLYGAVQEAFLEKLFDRLIEPGMAVVDVGCGTGYYSSRMASRGAIVTGLDPDPSYLKVAGRAAGPTVTFRVAPIGEPGALDDVPDASADLVFISDALLFYFVAPAPGPTPSLDVLLGDIRRILRRDGKLVSVEPHSTFWLAPWLGDVDTPFTVLTEYAERTFLVTPQLSDLVNAFTSRGFGVVALHEPSPAAWLGDEDPRAFHFAAQFPLWNILELVPLESRT